MDFVNFSRRAGFFFVRTYRRHVLPNAEVFAFGEVPPISEQQRCEDRVAWIPSVRDENVTQYYTLGDLRDRANSSRSVTRGQLRGLSETERAWPPTAVGVARLRYRADVSPEHIEPDSPKKKAGTKLST